MNLTSMAARKIALPPLDEQWDIVELVQRETANIDAWSQGFARRLIALMSFASP